MSYPRLANVAFNTSQCHEVRQLVAASLSQHQPDCSQLALLAVIAKKYRVSDYRTVLTWR